MVGRRMAILLRTVDRRAFRDPLWRVKDPINPQTLPGSFEPVEARLVRVALRVNLPIGVDQLQPRSVAGGERAVLLGLLRAVEIAGDDDGQLRIAAAVFNEPPHQLARLDAGDV